MTKETILAPEQLYSLLTNAQIQSIREDSSTKHNAELMAFTFARAIEQAVLQSPEIQAMRKDAERYRWLLKNEDGTSISMTFEGNTGATPYINGEELEKAIDAAMENQE